MNKRMRLTAILCGALGAAFLLIANGCSEKKEVKSEEVEEQEAVVANKILEFERMEQKGSVTVGGLTYDYILVREPAADLPLVYNEMRGDVRDNTITLTLQRGGEQLYHHQFTKEAFKVQTPEDVYSAAVLQEAGVMEEQQDGWPRFWFSLGEPYADLVTFVVTLSPDGSFTYKPDEVNFMPED